MRLSEEDLEQKQKIRKAMLYLLGVSNGFLIGVVFMLFIYTYFWG